MSQISRIKTWTAEVLYSADLNAEFNNILNYWNGADAASNAWTSLAVTNNATIGGTLSVTGTTTLGTVNISGTGTIGTLAVTGNGTVTGTFNVTGAVNFSSTLGVVGAISIAATSNQFIIGSARTVTISAPTPASASRVWTIPDISTDGTFASLTGTQTFSGAKTFSASATFASVTATGNMLLTNAASGSLTLLASASGTDLSVAVRNTSNTASSDSKLTLSNGGSSAGDSFIFYEVTGSQYFTTGIDNSVAGDPFVISRSSTLGTNNAISISGTTSAVELQGTTTNDSAAAGKVGEYLESVPVSGASLTNITYSDGGNSGLTLTPGDWDVWAICIFGPAATTNVLYVEAFIGTASGNSAIGGDSDRNYVVHGYGNPGIVPVYNIYIVTPLYRVSISSDTTYYPKLRASFGTSTMSGKGNIFARRRR